MHPNIFIRGLKAIFWRPKNNFSNSTRIIIGLMAVFLGAGLARSVVISDGVSLDQSILIMWPGKPEVNDYVTFTIRKNELIDHDVRVSKKVGCVEGDLLEIRDGNAFFCNYILIGHAKKTTRDGRPLKMFDYQGRVPAGKLFAFGTHPDSYDSRYIGFIDVNETQRLKGVVNFK